MTRGTPPRRTPSSRGGSRTAPRSSPGRTPGGRATTGRASDTKRKSFNFSIFKPDGSINLNRIVLYLLLVLVLVVVTFPFWRGIVFPDPVDVAFAELSPEQRAYVRTQPPEIQTLLQEMIKSNPQMAADVVAAIQKPVARYDDLLPSGTRVVADGVFSRQDALHGAEGAVVFYRAQSSLLLRLENFRATNGPELHLFLSTEAAPVQTGSLGAFVDLGPLKGTAGNIIYYLDVSLAGFKSLVIYDVKYQQIYSAATLTFR